VQKSVGVPTHAGGFLLIENFSGGAPRLHPPWRDYGWAGKRGRGGKRSPVPSFAPVRGKRGVGENEFPPRPSEFLEICVGILSVKSPNFFQQTPPY